MTHPPRIDPELARVLERAKAATAALPLPDSDAPTRTQAALRHQRAFDRLSDRLPWRDQQRILQGLVDSEVWRSVVEPAIAGFHEGNLSFLLISSASRTGKTVACANAISKIGGVMLSSAQMVRAYRYEHAEAIGLREQIGRARVLVIDDLGTEGGHEVEARPLFHVVNERQARHFLTVITTNELLPNVMLYGDRTIGRIRDSGAVVSLASIPYGAAP